MAEPERRILLRDSTLREGLDTPGVRFSTPQGIEIARALAEAGVPEAEVVAPARVDEGLAFVAELRAAGVGIRTSGLIYVMGKRFADEVDRARDGVDRFDVLMPLSSRREPSDRREKIARLRDALATVDPSRTDAGAGFPHATQVEPEYLLETARAAVDAGARRLTVYDTNGSADPFVVRSLLERLTGELSAPIFFHAHNDLGLATANAFAAVMGGASGLDVTVNGLGDRAGNASLEQVVMALRERAGLESADPAALLRLSEVVAERSGVAVSRLAPVVGDLVFAHRSPSHLPLPSEFEAFSPETVGRGRQIERVEGGPVLGGRRVPS